MKSILLIILAILFSLNGQALFEIKDASDNTVFSIAEDGLRVFNLGDTLMVISATEIKANISDGKGKALCRSFSVTTSTTGKAGLSNILEVTTEATSMREGVLGERYTDFSPENIFLGLNAGINTIDSNNVFVGNEAGMTNTTGYRNVFIGSEAGCLNTVGLENVFMGFMAGRSNLTGQRNICIGNEAGLLNIEGSQNISIGDNAGRNNTGDLNVFIGTQAGFANSGGVANTFLGNGAGSTNISGRENVYVGFWAGVGNYGTSNTFVGYCAGSWVSAGDGNVYVGKLAGRDNINGDYNVFIGNEVTVTGSNKLAIDNTDTATPLIYGDFATDELTINGKMYIPTLYTTTSASSRKYVFVDTAGKLCVASKNIEDPHDNEEIGLLKKDNEKLKTKIEHLESEIGKIKRLLNK